MSEDSSRLREQLERRAPGNWELFEKTAGSQELESTAAERATVARRETGWAARWWEGEAPRFACGSSPENLGSALADALRVETSLEPPPQWPETKSAAREPSAGARLEPPPDLFEELQRRVSAESRGEALLHRLTVRRGASAERIFNGRGLDVSTAAALLDGRALAIGRKGSRSCEARAVFRWEREPDLEGSRAGSRTAPRCRSPSTGPRSTAANGCSSLRSRRRCSPGSPRSSARTRRSGCTRRTSSRGTSPSRTTRPRTLSMTAKARRLAAWQSSWTERSARVCTTCARRAAPGLRPRATACVPLTGSRPPRPRRLFFETASPVSPRELLTSVKRGLFASALTAPAQRDFDHDRYEIEFTGIAVVGGRAQGPVASARARGRISQLLRRIGGLSTDRQFFPMPYQVGAPTLLIERADFE